MNKKLILGAITLAVCFSSAVFADEVFVRNRPFKNAVKSAGETYVPVDSFLKSLGYNWTVSGETVTLSQKAGPNPPLAAGNYQFVNGDKTLPLEVSLRGQRSYVSMSPLAKFLGFAVSYNQGITDVSKSRFANDSDKKAAKDVEAAKEADAKAKKEAWDKKVAELKAKRAEKDKDGAEGDKDKDADSDKDKDKDKDKIGDSSKPKGDKDKTKGKDKSPKETSKDEAKPSKDEAKDEVAAKDEKKNEPKAAPRLEVFQSDAVADYSTGDVKINLDVRNQGNGASGPVAGTVYLYGPSSDGNKEELWYKTSVRGPALKPDQNWSNSLTWRHRGGSSMPHGSMRVELKLGN